MKKYSLRLYFFNLGRKIFRCLKAINFKIFATHLQQVVLNSNCKPSLVKTFFGKVSGLESIPSILLKIL